MTGKPYVNESYMIYALFACSFITYANFAVSVCYQMSTHLGIYILHINEPKKGK